MGVMLTSVKDIDKKISDLFEDAANEQTVREFIRESENEFEMKRVDLDSMNVEQINSYLEFLSYLWTK